MFFLGVVLRTNLVWGLKASCIRPCMGPQGLMHPPCEVVLGKFSKRPRKCGFTRYYAGIYPSAQVPQPGVDLQAFDQGPRSRNVPHCFCQKGPRQINPVSYGSTVFLGILRMKLSGQSTSNTVTKR